MVIPDESQEEEQDDVIVPKVVEEVSAPSISKKPVAISDETRYREIDPTKIQIERDFQKEASFDDMTTKHLTISDLKKMKKEQGKGVSKSV